MKRILLLTFAVMAGISTLFAQNKVTGTVTSAEDGSTMPYVTVVVAGTSIATQTDLDGKYAIAVPAGNNALTFTFVGMKTVTVEINGRSVVDVAMNPDAIALDDAIVVAYGTAKRESITGSATSVDSEKLQKRVVSNVTKALDGLATGVQTTSSGQPGSGSSVIIRGFGSINASNSPLYVVDGAPFDGSLNSINPMDIESMTILKDASAAALYGARAANGVVMITTKRAKTEKVHITYNGSAGWSNRAMAPYDMVDQREFVNMTYESLRNSYAFGNGYNWETASAMASNGLSGALGGEIYNPYKNYTWNTLIDPSTGLVRSDAVSAYNEDWMAEVTNTNAFRHEHQVSLSGGTDKVKAMFSMGYVNEDGVLINTGFERFSGRTNVDLTVNDWIKGGLNLSASMTQLDNSAYDGSSTANVWYTAQFMAPIYPVYLKDASGNDILDALGNRQLDYGATRPKSSNFSCIGTQLDDYNGTKRDNVGARTFLTIGSDSESAGWARGLKLTANFSADYSSADGTNFYNLYHGNAQAAHGRLTKNHSRLLSYTFNQLLTYNRTFGGKHTIDFLGGHEFYSYDYSYLTGQKTNLVDGIIELRPGTTIVDADSYSNTYRIESYLSRLNYNYADKYYISASFRTDGTSRFYKDSRWGNFWSVGANWRISQEGFMKSVTWVNNLALRASYGVQGNDSVGSLYAWQSFYDLGWPNANNTGAMVSSLESRDLRWEKNENLNIGLDARLFNSRLDMSFEWYRRYTRDMLLSYPMAMSTGFTGYNANVGDMVNSGFEFSIGGQIVDTRNFRWRVNVMGSTIHNEVLKLTEESPQIISGVRVIEVGRPLNTFFLAKSAGVDPATGSQLYWVYDNCDHFDGDTPMTADGTPCEIYRSSDYAKAANSKFYQGNRMPQIYGSISTDFTFFNCLDLSVMTTYSLGGKIYDGLYAGSMMPMYTGDTWNVNALRRWRKPGDITDVPRAEINGQYTASDRFLVDASYFAIKNITLGYSLPAKYAKKIKASLLRVYVTLDNFMIFDHLDGMDPQYNFTGATDYVYSPNKTYSVGLNINF